MNERGYRGSGVLGGRQRYISRWQLYMKKYILGLDRKCLNSGYVGDVYDITIIICFKYIAFTLDSILVLHV